VYDMRFGWIPVPAGRTIRFIMLAVGADEIASGVLTLLFGLFFGLGGCWWLGLNLRMRARAMGTVVDVEPLEDEAGVSFRTADGTLTYFTGVAIGHLGKWGTGVGQTVPVRYNPRHPEKARIATFAGSYLYPVIGLLAGAGLLWVAGAFLTGATAA
jgi:hypothetical protein